jgi:type IV secretion system protein VirB9
MPAILVKDHEGTEGPVNFAVRGDVIVVDGVPREIVLRAGNDSATLINRGPVREARQAALAQPARDNTEIKR